MFDRLINIFFSFALVFIFLLSADSDDQLRIFIAIFLSLFCAYLGFVLNWLTLDGATSASLFGVIAYGLGGLSSAVIVLAFFISSSIVSKDQISAEGFLKRKFRRDGRQVWSNGFWFALWIIIWFLSAQQAFLIAAISSIAFATSDTWASEIGTKRTESKTYLITDMKTVKPGTDGGVSLIGTFASFVGAALISFIFWSMNMDQSMFVVLLISISGFVGNLADSLFGAKVQGKKLPPFFGNLFARQISYVDNNMVNWLAGGTASIVALILVLIVGY